MHLADYPHRRYNPLSGEWVLCSPHRTKRPWQGQVEKPTIDDLPVYDPSCYLCPGNDRAGGLKNPAYPGTFVFVNDFSALLEDAPEESLNEKDIFVASNERGLCKVICFSPRHDMTLARMDQATVRAVVDVWVEQYVELSALENVNYVQIFENRGAMMGCSNPHPHGQVWASSMVPDLPAKETENLHRFKEKNGCCLLCDYVKMELEKNERIVVQNDSFVSLVPFWATWPYEMMTLPKRHMGSIDEMTSKERDDLADILRQTGVRYDNLFLTSFPYSMGIHQKPSDGSQHDEWHFHLHYYPPLLRSATVKKFMVGFEMLGMAQRDITPESAALKLRECSPKHYREV